MRKHQTGFECFQNLNSFLEDEDLLSVGAQKTLTQVISPGCCCLGGVGFSSPAGALTLQPMENRPREPHQPCSWDPEAYFTHEYAVLK